MKLVIGIDEAGRGPLIGPMIIAGVVLDYDATSRLSKLGVRDSKVLLRHTRERLYEAILSTAEHVIIVEVPPETIDTVNLNLLEHDTITYMVSRCIELYGDRVVRVSIDTVGKPSTLEAIVRKVVGSLAVEVHVAEKAEQRFVEVAAASIVAKVVRDKRIEEISRIYGDIGSGYPTDPKTISWVREAYKRSPENPPPIVRRTWSTLRRIAPKWYVDKKRLVGASGGHIDLLNYLTRRARR